MQQIIHATKTILSKKGYLFSFIILTVLSFALFIFLQVWTILGNSLSFQLQVLTFSNYILMDILSILVALFVTMQAFIFRNAYSAQTKLASVGKGGTVGYLGVFAAVLGTATCASCLIALFGFLGFGSIVFLLKNQWWVVSFAIILLLVSLYFSSRKVNGVCESCRVEKEQLK